MLSQVFFIGITFIAAQLFGYVESQLFNSYLEHVILRDFILRWILIGTMVILSATAGLITQLVFGILSDNTRSRFGRRRPWLLSGGIIAGIAMIFFAFTFDYVTALILDVIVVAIGSNMYYIAQRAFIPDLVDVEHRGRANGIANILGVIGMLLGAVISLLILEWLFGVPGPGGGTIITREGYILALSMGGLIFIITGIIGFIFIKERKGSDLPPKKSFKQEFKEIFRIEEFKEHKEFHKLIVAITIYYSGISMILTFLFIFIFSLNLSLITLLLAIVIAGPSLFAVTYLLGHYADRFGRKKFLIPTILISCLGFVILPFVLLSPPTIFTFPVLTFALALVFTALLGIETPLNAFYQDLLPEATRGKYLGLYNIVRTASQIIGTGAGMFIATFFNILFPGFGLYALFLFAPVFFIGSIPIFLTVKETLPGREKEKK